MHLADKLERGPVGDGVDEHVAVDANRQAGGDERVLVLAGGVNDVALVFLAVVFDGLGEGVLDGGEILLVEVVLDELDDERGFAWGGRVSWRRSRRV